MREQALEEDDRESLSTETILIVDDDAVNIRLLLEVLEQDYRVLVANGGEKALQLLSKHADIDLMLLDVDMPDLTGFDVLHKVRSQPQYQELPVILVTGRNQAGDEVFGFEQGASDYISKPISAPAVKARIKTQLTLAKAKNALSEKNRELEKALRETQAAKDELTEFTAMVSHELRTPVAILLCEIELLVDGIRKPDQKNLESLQEEVKHFSSLINDLFDLVLAEAKTLKYDKHQCHPDQLIARSVELFYREFNEAKLQLSVNTNDIAGTTIYADPQRIRQVIDNILKNTLKYTDGPGKLEITTERNNGFVWIHFQDTPPCVAEDEIDKLFDKLYRVEKSRNRATGGAGLGLAICKTIVADHGGCISAQKSPLGGLWISVQLPESSDNGQITNG